MSSVSSKSKSKSGVQSPISSAAETSTTQTGSYAAVNWGPWWGLLMIVSSFLGAQVVGIAIVSAIPNILQMSRAEATVWLNSTTGQFLFVLIAESVALLFLWLFLRERGAGNLKAVGITRPWKPSDIGYALLGGVGYFAVLGVASSIITNIFGEQPFNQQQELGFNAVTTHPALFLTFVSLVVIPPIVEEVLFRGVLFGGLRRKFSFVWAMLITSIVFAIPHLAEAKGGGVLWLAGLDTLVLSFFLCLLREKTGSLWSSIFLHMTKNGLAFVSLFIVHH